MTSFRDVQKQIDKILAEAEARYAEIEKEFDPYRGEIDLRISSLTLLKNTDWPQKVNEVYATVAVVAESSDESGLQVITQKGEPAVWNIKKNEPMKLDRSFLLYSSGNPGRFLNWRIDFYEDDKKLRNVASSIAKLTKDPDYKKKVEDLTKSFNSTQVEAGVQLVNFVGGFIAGEVAKSKDKHLGTFQGTLLRDEPSLGTYGLKEPYWSERNAYLKVNFRVEPNEKKEPAEKLRTKVIDTVRFKPTVVRP
ncbi:MAG: hypothetical protein AAF773_03870 [Cyanobacteria bacterium P01_D01_bin.115]